MKLGIKQKLVFFSVGLVLLVVVSFIVVNVVMKARIDDAICEEVNKLAKDNVAQTAEDVYQLVDAVNSRVQKEVTSSLNMARKVLQDYGEVRIDVSRKVRWRAVNQFTEAVSYVDLPVMFIGDMALVAGGGGEVSVADEVKKVTGCTCSIFQRVNEAGDMLRVSTTVVKKDGTRSLGEYIPAVNPDGTPNPIISSVLRGKTYLGRSYAGGFWYVAVYEPIKGKDGKIVGILAVGVRLDAMEDVKRRIMDIKVGKTGYVYILGGKGSQKGVYIVSKGGQRDGENIWEARDASGRYFIQDIINKALKLKPDEIAFDRYPWKNKGEKEARWKIAAIKYFEPWDWVIGAGMYEDDLYEVKRRVSTALNKITFATLVLGIVVLVIGGIIAVVFGNGITKPIISITGVARKLAKGDLEQQVDHTSNDEIGVLADSFREMIDSMKEKEEIARRLSHGDFDVEVNVRSDKDVLGRALARLKDVINRVISSIESVVKAMTLGNLDVRINTDEFEGRYSELVGELNNLVEVIDTPIAEISEVLDGIANGDLTKKIVGDYKGRFLDLKESINKTIGSLNEALAKVADAVDQVNSASNQISSGSQSLAEAANEQASSLEEVSSSLEEMSSMVRQNADNTNQAKAMMTESDRIIQEGKEAIRELEEAIKEIKRSAVETSKIVGTIDEIAFQTNLLALNAAVEAARAGEHGRGFAVVAEEVRNLAQRSAEAAKNTAMLIDESGKNADRGVDTVNRTIEVFDRITERASKVLQIIEEIAAASKEQSEGIEQINTAVGQMNTVVQQNAANSEESASAAEELNSQAQELASMISMFKLDRESVGATVSSMVSRTKAEKKVPEMAKVSAGKVMKGVRKEEAKSKEVPQGGNDKPPKPEEIIPLDEDEKHKDFEDF
ncbi:MAG: Cache 3/Cache 2 fusion domain-containing protein [Archaeoglobus sp.]|nr:Cache 3/Cache 2 fusion domain-containing protein [Archaeoglobus sp.]